MKQDLSASTTSAAMTTIASLSAGVRWFFSLEDRYLAPMFITCILAAAQWSFGVLESYARTVLAILTALGTECVIGRLFWGKWPHLASAYVSGISVGILLRSPAMWPYALGSLPSLGLHRHTA